MTILIIILLIILYVSLPLPLQIILFMVNFFVPDPIPLLDEVIMFVSMANKAKLLSRIYNLLQEHRVIGIIVIGAIIAGIVVGIIYTTKVLITFL